MSRHFVLSKWRLKFPMLVAPWLILLPIERCWDWGVLIATFGMAVRIWAAGHLGKPKEKVLVTTGPYAYLRHPLYLGTFFMVAGLSAVTSRPGIVGILIIGLLALYAYKVRIEESKLERRLGQEFFRYRKALPAFLTSSSGYTKQGSRFSWPKVWERHEYHSLIILLAVFFMIHANEYLWEVLKK